MYELVRLQTDMEERHIAEVEQKNADIADLTDLVEELAERLRQSQVVPLQLVQG